VESILIVNFNRPAASQVARSEKSDFSAQGFPVDVEVEGKDTAGRAIELQDAKLEVRLPGADWTIGPSPVLNGAKAVFPGTALATGTTGLRVTVTEKPSLRKATNTMDAVVPVGTGCAVAITSPPTNPFAFNISTNEGPGPQLQYTLKGTSDNCPGVPITLSKGTSAPITIASGMVNAAGAYSVPFALADGEQTRLNAQMTDPFPPNPATSASVDVTVKISPPVLSNFSPPYSPLYYVADSNIYLGRPGYVQNIGPDDSALQANFSFTVTKAAGGLARLVYNGANVASAPAVSITADPQTVTWPNVSLPPKSSGPLEMRATDGVGNETIRRANLTIDVIPPAPTSCTDAGLAPDGGRTATVNLQWGATGDDGFAGTPAGYDLRWSTSTVIGPDAGYFDPNMFTDGGILPPTALSKQLTPLPPLNTYLFQVRGFDAIGTYARQSPQVSVDNFWNRTSVTNPGPGTGFGLHLAAGDFDGDGRSDLVVNASTTDPGAIYVYMGLSDLSTLPTVPPVTLGPRDGQNGFFGLDFAVGNVSGDTLSRSDLLVSQNVWSCNGIWPSRGRAFLYIRNLGRDGSPTCIPTSTTNRCLFEFRGPIPGPNSFGATSRIIPDINGDGIDEVVITSHRENGARGRVYLFYGRTQAGWNAITTADDTSCPTSGGALYIPTSAADRFFDGDADGGTGTFFGRLHGYTTIDNRPDAGALFTVPASNETLHKLFVHSAAVVQGWDGGIPTSARIQELNYGPDSPSVSSFGFGAEAIGFVNFIRGPAKDLLVTQPRFDKFYLFADGTSAGFTSGSPVIVSGSTPGRNFGASLAQGDLNGDGKPDIVVGENFSPGPSARQTPWIFYNTGPANQEFDSTAGAGFSQSRLLSTSTPSNLGIGVAVGDFNGDGRPDMAAGDSLDGSGRVTIWY
jgi:hypothetical protein